MSHRLSRSDVHVGDIVRLRSGGPFMTVSGTFPDCDVVTLSWFTPEHWLEHGESVCGALVAYSPEDVDLFAAAAAVWDVRRADGREGKLFDYLQDKKDNPKIERFAAALTAIDGRPRTWEPDSE